MLYITKTMNNDSLPVSLVGRLDTTTSPDLEAELRDLNGVRELILDMKELDYISSAGLRVLLGTLKRMQRQGTMEVRHVNETICEIFEVTGFSDILTIVK